MGWVNELKAYGRKSLYLLGEHKKLFIPPFVSITIALLFVGVLVRSLGGFIGDPRSWGIGLIIAIPLYIVVLTAIEAGHSNMFKQAANGNQPTWDDFFEGTRKYTLRLIGGSLLLGVLLILAFIFIGMVLAVIMPQVIATAMLGIMALIVSVFFSMWPVVLISEDAYVVESISDTWAFVKSYFWPLLLLGMVQSIFYLTQPDSSMGILPVGQYTIPFFSMEYFLPSLIVTLVFTLISVFFSQLLFVIYFCRKFKVSAFF